MDFFTAEVLDAQGVADLLCAVLHPVWSKISNALKRLGFRSRNFLAQLARNCCLLGRRRYWGDSVSELFGFGLEALDL